MIVVNAFIKKSVNLNGCIAVGALNKIVHHNNRRT